MNGDSPEMKDFFDRLRADTKKDGRQDMMETLVMAAIGAALGYWAYGTLAHALLFGFLVFAASAVGNRIVAELRMQRAQDEARRLMDQP
ncbi:hypothetical protein [Mesorhizobium sp.]|uniref:hypothetical protein n=1 Tax=Mesorhizobium sp. TaxID=1871066 RepID=UPI000FE4C9EB|nr:hypothetical protein [Mesorhizobium sp.]RWK63517.1 MAG: hypothetical protein EOR49_09430 [Mesorhizobium sp.]RWM51457.1 MAG: hypothetical protein EOR76_05705 [Mesorhizobium sp.]RWM59629.1 MAG: hypothetical protein EOR78_04175 [Mesorhizobium sp.]RWM60225.1 MAG: hypothetical protein EOR79_07945 [Mesorhizobium sp.]RWN03300.1 MAG: hypothetical protein EOR85_10435 [Mesorhizobium sp.]